MRSKSSNKLFESSSKKRISFKKILNDNFFKIKQKIKKNLSHPKANYHLKQKLEKKYNFENNSFHQINDITTYYLDINKRNRNFIISDISKLLKDDFNKKKSNHKLNKKNVIIAIQ